MIASNVFRHLVRAAAVALVLAPVLGTGLVLPAAAEESAKCEGTLLECFLAEAEAGAAKFGAAPTKAPVVGETLVTSAD